MLGVGRQQQLEKKTQEKNQFPLRKVFPGKLRELPDESNLIKATVKIPSDMRRIIVTNGNIKKSI